MNSPHTFPYSSLCRYGASYIADVINLITDVIVAQGYFSVRGQDPSNLWNFFEGVIANIDSFSSSNTRNKTEWQMLE